MNTDKLRESIFNAIDLANCEWFSDSPEDITNEIMKLPEMKELLKEKVCEWRHDEDIEGESLYGTSCGEEFYFCEGNIKDNATIFCPFCGGKIKEGLCI